jgi:deoxyribonuclease-4
LSSESESAALIGAHVSIAGGIDKAFARGEKIGCTAIQIFTRNASRWQVAPLKAERIEAFRAAQAQSSIRYLVAHDSYLINLASPDESLRQKSISAFIDELERCQRLGIPDLVMHPGAHVGSGSDVGLQRVVESLASILDQTPAAVRILIENTAGQGSSLGASFEELATLLEAFSSPRLAICFDTCHAFAAGYDLRGAEGYHRVMEEFDRLIGLDQLALFHLNDSKKPFASRVDRHEQVARGEIGAQGFAALLCDERFGGIAKIIETAPGEGDCLHLESLALLRSMERGDFSL